MARGGNDNIGRMKWRERAERQAVKRRRRADAESIQEHQDDMDEQRLFDDDPAYRWALEPTWLE